MTEEDLLQEEIVIWFRKKYSYKSADPFAIIFSVPNGGKRGWFDAKVLQATGLLAGVTDLLVVHDGITYYIELKTKTGTLQKSQKVFKKMLTMAGCADKWHLVRSLEDFKNVLKEIGLN